MVAVVAVNETPIPHLEVVPEAETTLHGYAGTTKRLEKTPSDAAPLAPLRETGTPGTKRGVVAW